MPDWGDDLILNSLCSCSVIQRVNRLIIEQRTRGDARDHNRLCIAA